MPEALRILLCLVLSVALGKKAPTKVNITRAQDFVDFSLKDRSSSENHAILCVLDDLDFAGIANFTPFQYFSGVFDGQGYLIKNLHINESNVAGLFGYAKGITIRNTIMDASCSVNNNGKQQIRAGSLIGSCTGFSRPCILVNNVNMGNIIFSLSHSVYESVMIGGIVGSCVGGRPYECTISNCANYGKINAILSNSEDFTTFIGGIAGYMEGTTVNEMECGIHNSINYGEIAFDDIDNTLSYSFIGGIVGSLQRDITIENCVSMGNLNETAYAISGHVYGLVRFKNCYWYEYLNEPFFSGNLDNISTENVMSFNDDLVLGDGTRLVDTLNSFVDTCSSEKSGWLINRNNKHVRFYVNGRKQVELSEQLILMPSLSQGNFAGWYTDKKFTSKVNSSEEVRRNERLYSKFQESFCEKSYVTATGTIIGYIFLTIIFLMSIGIVIFVILHLFRGPNKKYKYIQELKHELL